MATVSTSSLSPSIASSHAEAVLLECAGAPSTVSWSRLFNASRSVIVYAFLMEVAVRCAELLAAHAEDLNAGNPGLLVLTRAINVAAGTLECAICDHLVDRLGIDTQAEGCFCNADAVARCRILHVALALYEGFLRCSAILLVLRDLWSE